MNLVGEMLSVVNPWADMMLVTALTYACMWEITKCVRLILGIRKITNNIHGFEMVG